MPKLLKYNKKMLDRRKVYGIIVVLGPLSSAVRATNSSENRCVMMGNLIMDAFKFREA